MFALHTATLTTTIDHNVRHFYSFNDNLAITCTSINRKDKYHNHPPILDKDSYAVCSGGQDVRTKTRRVKMASCGGMVCNNKDTRKKTKDEKNKKYNKKRGIKR